MKITLIISSLACGGAERVVSDMANYWVARNHNVTLITSTGPDVADFYFLDSRVGRIWLGNARETASFADKVIRNVMRIFRLRRAIVASGPEVVISLMDVNNVLTILATRGLGTKVIVSERTDPSVNPYITLPWRLLRRLCYRWADGVVAQTRSAANWVEKYCSAKVWVIPNALRELPHLALKENREKVVLAVGRLGYEKGFDILINAFSRLSSDFPSWRLVILGDGPERGKLEELVDRCGLKEIVTFPGRVKDPERWMGRAAIFAMTSRFEGFPNALLEAMGMGAAVVATDCRSGPGDVIHDYENGRLIEVESQDRLVQALDELMRNDQLCRKFGDCAVEVRFHYSQERIMGLWEKCLTERY